MEKYVKDGYHVFYQYLVEHGYCQDGEEAMLIYVGDMHGEYIEYLGNDKKVLYDISTKTVLDNEFIVQWYLEERGGIEKVEGERTLVFEDTNKERSLVRTNVPQKLLRALFQVLAGSQGESYLSYLVNALDCLGYTCKVLAKGLEGICFVGEPTCEAYFMEQ